MRTKSAALLEKKKKKKIVKDRSRDFIATTCLRSEEKNTKREKIVKASRKGKGQEDLSL